MKLLSAIDENKDVVSKEWVDNTEVAKKGVLNVLRYPETTGYLKFAECDLSAGGYGNKYVVLFVTTEYGTSTKVGNGIVYINIRGNGTSASSVTDFFWLLNNGTNNTVINTLCWAVNDHKIEFYRKAYSTNEYSQVSFKILHIGDFESAPNWNFVLKSVPFVEGTPLDTPIGTIHEITSGGLTNWAFNASKATGDKNGNDITTTYYKASNPNGYTSNTGTITGINMNGASKGTSGVVDLGTVLTSHQSIKTVNNNTMTGTGNVSVGTITKVQANGTDVASSGTANIPAANTSAYGVTKLSNATDSTSEVLAATPKAVKAAYDLAAGKGTGTITGVSVNGTSVATSGVANITSVPASILSGAIKNGVTATTQSAGDNSTKVATTAYVDTAITNLPEPMIFKGSLGTGGTITTLPAASSSNEGYTYKVITAGTYASQSAKVGDTFISDGSSWVLIPSGDEPSGTVTSVTLKATSPIAIDSESAITSSGTRTLSHANSGVTAGTYKSVTVNATGHVTGGTNPTTLSGYGITDAKINNGTITLGSNTITPLTSFTETDPVFSASPAAGITAANITAWNSAEANVQADWNQTTTTADDYIKNKPTIPTVNNGTLTIQKNGTNVQTFTANQSGNATANITVPTQTSNLTNNGADGSHPFVPNYSSNNDLAGLSASGDHLVWLGGVSLQNHQVPNILSGTADPTSSQGSNGDIYIKIDTTT